MALSVICHFCCLLGECRLPKSGSLHMGLHILNGMSCLKPVRSIALIWSIREMSHANTGCYAVDRGGFLLSVIFSARIVIRKHDHEARK